MLRIRPGYIELAGFDTGFIGGAAFRISERALAFTGRLDSHPDRADIEAFLRSRGIEPVYLTDRPAFDIGSAVPAHRGGSDILPMTEGFSAPVTPGRVFGRPARQRSPSMAKATASFASLLYPRSS